MNNVSTYTFKVNLNTYPNNITLNTNNLNKESNNNKSKEKYNNNPNENFAKKNFNNTFFEKKTENDKNNNSELDLEPKSNNNIINLNSLPHMINELDLYNDYNSSVEQQLKSDKLNKQKLEKYKKKIIDIKNKKKEINKNKENK